MSARHNKGSKLQIDSTILIGGDELPPLPELHQAIREARPRQRLQVEPPLKVGLGRRLAIAVIGLYQRRLSARVGRKCMLEPSCSRYAALAIAHNGLWRGSREVWWRLRRCRPENEGKIDYPEGVRICPTK